MDSQSPNSPTLMDQCTAEVHSSPMEEEDNRSTFELLTAPAYPDQGHDNAELSNVPLDLSPKSRHTRQVSVDLNEVMWSCTQPGPNELDTSTRKWLAALAGTTGTTEETIKKNMVAYYSTRVNIPQHDLRSMIGEDQTDNEPTTDKEVDSESNKDEEELDAEVAQYTSGVSSEAMETAETVDQCTSGVSTDTVEEDKDIEPDTPGVEKETMYGIPIMGAIRITDMSRSEIWKLIGTLRGNLSSNSPCPDKDSESSSSEDNSDSKNSQDAQCTSRVTTEVACQTEDRPPTGCSKHRYMEILERSKVVMLPHFYEAVKSNLEARICTDCPLKEVDLADSEDTSSSVHTPGVSAEATGNENLADRCTSRVPPDLATRYQDIVSSRLEINDGGSGSYVPLTNVEQLAGLSIPEIWKRVRTIRRPTSKDSHRRNSDSDSSSSEDDSDAEVSKDTLHTLYAASDSLQQGDSHSTLPSESTVDQLQGMIHDDIWKAFRADARDATVSQHTLGVMKEAASLKAKLDGLQCTPGVPIGATPSGLNTTNVQHAAAAYMEYRRQNDIMLTLRQGCKRGLNEVSQRLFMYRQIRQSCLQRIPFYVAGGVTTDRFLSHQVDTSPPLLSDENLRCLKALVQHGFRTCRPAAVPRSEISNHISELRDLLSTLYLMRRMMERVDRILTLKGEILEDIKVIDKKALQKPDCFDLPTEATF